MQELGNKKLKIAIFGASSQVGSSVAFYLKHFTIHEPICFIRSYYSLPFFEMAGIKTIKSDITDTEVLRDDLKDTDVVIDFTYPAEETFKIPRIIKKTITNIISSMPSHAIYIYMSSIMAHGMPDGEKWVRTYSLPRGTYARIKRIGEKAAQTIGSKYNITVYSFRLGQVHGFLQSVSESFQYKLSVVKNAYLNGYATDPTNTIFISALSEAIVKCALIKIKPGVYTLVAYPQWSLLELYNFYLDFFSLTTRLVYKPQNADNKFSLKKIILKGIKNYRPLIETYMLIQFPNIYIRAKGKFRTLEMNREAKSPEVSYLDFNLLGIPPGPIIKNATSSIGDVWKAELSMQTLYLSLLEQHTK